MHLMGEVNRILKPGGSLIGGEVYIMTDGGDLFGQINRHRTPRDASPAADTS
jgi:hypothetical protein